MLPRMALALLATVATAMPARAQLDGVLGQPPAGSRPRIGLVLGGGGAKGGAHVGVISVLEEMRIPVDCLVGTSMGALVGGTYASGMTAAEVDEAVRGISFREVIGFKGRREGLPMRRKLAGDIFSNGLEFGVHAGRFTAPSGFINTQNIEQLISLLVSRSLGVRDFDKMPIPFRAIATDMQTGDMVVLADGDLRHALRASMSVPGVFAPVMLDGRVLGDGGLSRNMPVDIARDLCADVVIAVSVPNPVPTPEELRSPLTMVSRTLDVLVGANERQQLETLGPRDVSIVVPMGDITSGAFDRVNEAIPLGRTAALGQREELARYSVSEAEYAAWRTEATRAEHSKVELADVQVHGLERVQERQVRRSVGLQPGDIVDQRMLSDKVTRLFSVDEFEGVEYELRGDPVQPVLDLHLREKSWGPNIVRFDIGLQTGTDFDTAFVLGGTYLRSWVNSLGGEVHGALFVGRTSDATLSLYQPLETRMRYFVEPGVSARRSSEDFFDDGNAVARFDLESMLARLDVGRVFGTRADLRVGVVTGVQSADRDIGATDIPQLTNEGYGGWMVRAVYDTRDRPDVATHGLLGRLRYFKSSESLGSEFPLHYEKLDAMLAGSMPFWNDLLHLRVTGGTSFDTQLPIYDLSVLGGPISFPGLRLGELRGQDYWTGSAVYMHRVAELSSLFGRALYVGGALTVGDMEQRIDQVKSDPIYSGTLLLGGRTLLGPLRMLISYTSNDDWQFVLGIGRPIEEGAITDPVW